MSNLRTSRRYTSAQATEAEKLNRPRFIFTSFRPLDVSKMNICVPSIPRCEIVLIESFPVYKPNYGEMIDIDVARPAMHEKPIAAGLQVDTLLNSFAAEGLVVLDVTEDQADKIAVALEGIEKLNFADAVLKVAESGLEDALQRQVLKSLQVATRHARGVLSDCKREIQAARSGKAGKDFLDDRDQNACVLLGVTEASIMSLEGAASSQVIENLAEKIALAVQRPSTPNTVTPELLAAFKEQSETIKRLSATVETLQRTAKAK